MSYTKDFEGWTQVKQSIQEDSKIPPGYKEREIWWVRLGINIGDEEDGKGMHFSRPVLIIRGFSKYLVWIVPLTTNQKTGNYYYPTVVDGRPGAAILSQLRVLDTRRFVEKIGTLDPESFSELKSKLIALF